MKINNNFVVYNNIENLNYKQLEKSLQNSYRSETGESYWFMLECIYERSEDLYYKCKKVAKVLLKFYQRPATIKSKLLLTMDKYQERKREIIRMRSLETLSLCLNRNEAGKQINGDILQSIKEYL